VLALVLKNVVKVKLLKKLLTVQFEFECSRVVI
jgi:hypothetical protein